MALAAPRGESAGEPYYPGGGRWPGAANENGTRAFSHLSTYIFQKFRGTRFWVWVPSMSAVISDRPDRVVVTVKQACEITNLSSETLYRMHQRGEGPPRVQLSTRRVGYNLGTLRAWLKQPPPALVKEQPPCEHCALLRDALISVEWVGYKRFRCIECGGQPTTGHTQACRVGRALSGGAA